MQKLHPRAVWLFFFSSIIGGIFVYAFIAAWIILFFSLATGFSAVAKIILIILIASIPATYIWARLTYRFYRYELTDTAFRKEHGIIWKKYVTIPYDRIQNIDIYRGLIARLLGLSDVQIQTAGGITRGSYGAFAEGRLPGLDTQTAEQLREELIRRGGRSTNQGL